MDDVSSPSSSSCVPGIRSFLERNWLFAALVFCVSCSETTESTEPASAGEEASLGNSAGASGTETTKETTAAPKAIAPASCGGEEWPAPVDTQAFSSLAASLVDQFGAPAMPALQVCSFDLCLFGSPSEDGLVKFGHEADMIAPAFKVGLGFEFAAFAYRLPNTSTHELGVVTALRLPSSETGEPIESASTSTSGGVTLSLSEGTEVIFDGLSFAPGSAQYFRAAVPAEFSHPAVDPRLGIEIVVGTTPVGTTFCPPATLSVPNVRHWPAGAEVELLVHGVKLTQKFAPYGEFAPHAVGRVDASGDEIVFVDQVETLSTFGLRLLEP